MMEKPDEVILINTIGSFGLCFAGCWMTQQYENASPGVFRDDKRTAKGGETYYDLMHMCEKIINCSILP